jgi:excisionase family DNA binding protein
LNTGNGAVASIPLTLDDGTVERLADLLAERLGSAVDDGWLDVAGAAAYLSCGSARIYALSSQGALPCERDGSRLLFSRAALRAYVLEGGAKRR